MATAQNLWLCWLVGWWAAWPANRTRDLHANFGFVAVGLARAHGSNFTNKNPLLADPSEARENEL